MITVPRALIAETIEVIAVLSGRGSTTVWNDKGDRLAFEWGPGSLFAIPLNAAHQHFNGSGTEPARVEGLGPEGDYRLTPLSTLYREDSA